MQDAGPVVDRLPVPHHHHLQGESHVRDEVDGPELEPVVTKCVSGFSTRCTKVYEQLALIVNYNIPDIIPVFITILKYRLSAQ